MQKIDDEIVDASPRVFRSLANTFDIPEDSVVDVSSKSELSTDVRVDVPESADLDSDANAVRDTLYNLLKNGEEAFNDLKRIAVAEESPRSFEVLNGLLGNLSDIAMKLMDVHEKKAKIQKAKSVDEVNVNNGSVITNNTVFVGTTADLQNAIKQLNNVESISSDEE